MPGQRCIVCGNTQSSDSFHQIPKEGVRRAIWMSVFDLKEENIKPSTRVCCRHFSDGDTKKNPDLTLGMGYMDCICVPYVYIHISQANMLISSYNYLVYYTRQ